MIAISISLICLLVYLFLRTKTSSTVNFAPGPWGFPIFGILPLLGKNPAATILKWTKKYGPIISVRLGSYPAVVINDAKLIKAAFALPAFSGRPHVPLLDLASSGRKGVTFGDGAKWREQRKFMTRNLKDFGLGSPTMEDAIIGDIAMIRTRLGRAADSGKPFQVHHFFSLYTLKSVWNITTGEFVDPEGEHLGKLVQAASTMVEFPKFGEKLSFFLPQVNNWFPVWSGSKKRVDSLKQIQHFLESQTNRSKNSRLPNRPRNIIEAFLEKVENTVDEESSFHSKHNYIIPAMQDIFMGSIETTSTGMEWIFYYLAKYPKVQAKLQKEVLNIIGNSRAPCAADRSRMPYSEAFINEVLRITSFFPFALFHRTLEDVEFNSYHIPKNTMVLANLYAAHNDPQVWDEPRELRPERFLGAERNTLNNKELIPFGSGARRCLGMDIAKLQLFLTTTSICQAFTICSTGILPDDVRVFGFVVASHEFQVFIKNVNNYVE